MQFIEPVNITPSSTNTWQDRDLSSYIPSGSTGVIIRVHSSWDDSIGFRKKGSTDNRTDSIGSGYSFMNAFIGCDANRVIQLYASNVSSGHITVYLLGYFGSEAVFFTNAIQKTIGADNSWQDISIASDTGDDTAIGAFFEFTGITNVGMRKNGSTDNRTTYNCDHKGIIAGLDGSEVCEGYLYSRDYGNFYLTGYIKNGAVFNTNATDITPGTSGSWVDLSAFPSGAIGGMIEVYNSTGDVGFRKKGSTEDFYRDGGEHTWVTVGCDENRVAQAKIESTSIKLYLIGYFVSTEVDTDSERSATTTGSLGSYSERGVVITSDGIYNARWAKLLGYDTDLSERSAKTEGTGYGNVGLKIALPGHSVYEADRYLAFNSARACLKFLQTGKVSAVSATEIAVPFSDIVEFPIKPFVYLYNASTSKFSPVPCEYDEDNMYFPGTELSSGSYYYYFVGYA